MFKIISSTHAKLFAWGCFMNGTSTQSKFTTQSSSFQQFTVHFSCCYHWKHWLSLSFTHTLCLFLSPLWKGRQPYFSPCLQLLASLTLFFSFYKLCERMLSWLAGEDLVSQVAVGGQICWQSDKLTHLGHCSSAHRFPPQCIPAQSSTNDPMICTHQQKSKWQRMKHPATRETETKGIPRHVLLASNYLHTNQFTV